MLVPLASLFEDDNVSSTRVDSLIVTLVSILVLSTKSSPGSGIENVYRRTLALRHQGRNSNHQV